MAKRKYTSGMSKTQVVELHKLIAQKVDNVLPSVYASFAITLMDKYGWDKQQIADIVAETGALWNETANRSVDMRQWCIELCGIDVNYLARSKAKAGKTIDGIAVYDMEETNNDKND